MSIAIDQILEIKAGWNNEMGKKQRSITYEYEYYSSKEHWIM